MIGWLWRMIVGRFATCEHHWETIGKVRLTDSDTGNRYGICYILQCKHCGTLTNRGLTA